MAAPPYDGTPGRDTRACRSRWTIRTHLKRVGSALRIGSAQVGRDAGKSLRETSICDESL